MLRLYKLIHILYSDMNIIIIIIYILFSNPYL